MSSRLPDMSVVIALPERKIIPPTRKWVRNAFEKSVRPLMCKAPKGPINGNRGRKLIFRSALRKEASLARHALGVMPAEVNDASSKQRVAAFNERLSRARMGGPTDRLRMKSTSSIDSSPIPLPCGELAFVRSSANPQYSSIIAAHSLYAFLLWCKLLHIKWCLKQFLCQQNDGSRSACSVVLHRDRHLHRCDVNDDDTSSVAIT